MDFEGVVLSELFINDMNLMLIIGYLVRFVFEKGLYLFVDVFIEMIKMLGVFNVRFVIVGWFGSYC